MITGMKPLSKPLLLVSLTAMAALPIACADDEAAAMKSSGKATTSKRMDSATPLKIKQKDSDFKPLSDKELKEKLGHIEELKEKLKIEKEQLIKQLLHISTL